MKCHALMQSMQDPDHIHMCASVHDAGDHMCKDPACRRWFWSKDSGPIPVKKVKRVKPPRRVKT